MKRITKHRLIRALANTLQDVLSSPAEELEEIEICISDKKSRALTTKKEKYSSKDDREDAILREAFEGFVTFNTEVDGGTK